MSYSGYKEGLGNRLADYIGVDGTSIPAVRIVNPDEGKITKYVLEGEITAASLIDFYEQYNEDKLQPFIKSEEIPDSQDEPVIKVVGKQWKEIVKDESKDVLVKYYAPWCGHCKAVITQFPPLSSLDSSNLC